MSVLISSIKKIFCCIQKLIRDLIILDQRLLGAIHASSFFFYILCFSWSEVLWRIQGDMMASMGESRVGWSGGECRCPSDRHYRLPCCLIRCPLSCCCRRRCRKCYWCHLTGRRNFWIMLNFLCFNGSLIIMRLNKTTQVLNIRFKYLVGWIFELNQFASKFELKLIFLINSL